MEDRHKEQGRQRRNRKKTQRTRTTNAVYNKYGNRTISITTLNVSGLNKLIQGHKVVSTDQKPHSTICVYMNLL